MLKMMYLCRRRPDLTRERYAELVLRGHAPLARKHHPAMRRYVINIAEGTPPGGPEFDSLPALYFDSLEDYRERLYDSPEGREIIRRDVEGFMGGADAYATREVVHRDDAPRPEPGERSPGVKWVCPVARRPGTGREAFARHWLEVHAPLVLEHRPGAIRYVANVVEERLSETGEDWDGFAELHFASAEDAGERGFASPESAGILEADHARFIGRGLVYPVGEYVQK